MGAIRNIKLSELLLLVAKLNCEHKVVDVVFDEEENVIRFHPVDERREKDPESNPSKDGPPDTKIENLKDLF